MNRTPRRHRPGHPPEPALRALALGSPHAGQADDEVVAHVRDCSSCQGFAGAVRALFDDVHAPPGPCPDALVLVRLSEPDPVQPMSPELGRHLTACLDCALELEGLTVLQAGAAAPPVVARARGDRPSLLDRVRALVQFEMPLSVALTTRSASPATGEPDALYARALATYRAARYEQAVDDLRAAADAGAESAALRHYLGACLVHTGQFDDAIAAFDAAIAGRPRLAELRFHRAQALLLADRLEDGVSELRQAARLTGAFAEQAQALLDDIEAARSDA